MPAPNPSRFAAAAAAPTAARRPDDLAATTAQRAVAVPSPDGAFRGSRHTSSSTSLRAERLPLTNAERRFWLSHRLHEAPVANLARVLQLQGRVDGDAWRRAFAAVALAPSLRLRIVLDGGGADEPFGLLGAPASLEIDDATNDAAVDAAVADVLSTPYDLSRDAPFRGRLLRLADDEWRLVLGVHHTALDGWAFSRALSRALAAALRGTLPDWNVDRWRDARASSSSLTSPSAEALDAWRERLRGASTLALPSSRPPTRTASGRAVDAVVELDGALLARVEARARALGARLVHPLLACTAVEFARASGTDDVVLGTTRGERPLPDDHDGVDEQTLGCFVRTVPLRLSMPMGDTLNDAVVSTRAAVRAALSSPTLDAEDLGLLGPDAPQAAALFNLLPVRAFDDDFGGVRVRAGRVLSGGTGLSVAVTFDTGEEVPRVVVEASADVFDAQMPRRVAERIAQSLATFADEPTTTLRRIPRLLPEDRAAHARLQGAPEARAAATGGTLDRVLVADLDVDDGARPALVHGERSWSRRALLAEARAVAAGLRGRGAGPGRFVFVHTSDPVHTVRAILGTLLSGAAYVPLDPAATPARVDVMAAAARPVVTLRDDDVATLVADAGTFVDEPRDHDRPCGRDPAYVIFTSGSTGTPKGVVLSHDAVVAQLQSRRALGFDRVERSLLLAPFFFDGSVETLFWSLSTGGTLHVLDEAERRDPVFIRRVLRERQITYTSAVPTLWGAVLDAEPEPLAHLRFVIVGGEALPVSLVEKHRRTAPHARLVNEYGPTESCVFSTSWEAPKDGAVDVVIGTAAPHVTCHVLAADRGSAEPLPIGEPGELVVSGIGVADGYVGAPEVTAKVFVRGLVAPDEQAYRTGDLVRLRDDGNLEWLGRRDHQVKLRGVRIELDGVEAALAALRGVNEAAAVVKDGALYGYVAPGPVDEAWALATLAARLGEASTPSRLIVLPTLPKTANDKIDRKALPEPTSIAGGGCDHVEPAPGLEQAIAAVWQEVLGVQSVSATRSFFAYGGHSLQAAVVVARLKARLGHDIALSTFLTTRTVRAQAAHLQTSSPASSSASSSSSSAPSSASSAPSLLLPLSERSSSSGPAVVFLPGVGGHVFTFAGLAERLSCPAWGLRSHGTEPGEEPLASLEAIAARNIDELHRRGVDDVVLAGYSTGARVAFEMCAQLQRAGRAPRHLVVFDAFAPGYPTPLPAWQRAVLHVADFAGRDLAGKATYVRERLQSLAQKRAFSRGDVDAFAQSGLDDVDPVQRAQLQRLSGVTTLADHQYRPASRVDVPLTVFAAAEGFRWVATRTDDPLLGWTAWITAPITRVTLQGDHLGLFTDDNVARAAAALDDLVARAAAR
jgi:amino acid adenylation domain-containing protein